MDFSRSDRIAEEIKKVISQIISNDLKDPRIDGLISVTKVDVTKDLRHATIFISFYGDKTKKDSNFEVIKNAKGYIRRELASRIRMKYIPEISFKMDESIEYAIRINKLLEEVKVQDQAEKEGQ
ncbi:MAG TPA: 30S ribosome-binding factor RbfA [Thermoanaerobacterales bacterium]|nr:30S ribosome-binding factor RbfA [Thermoanaerobacterales bacterium]